MNDYKYIWTYGDSREAIWTVGFTVNSYGGALGTIFDNYNFVTYRPDYVPETWVIHSFDSKDLRAAAIFTCLLYTSGIAQNSTFRRYNIRTNADVKASKWLKVGTNTMAAYEEAQQADDLSLIHISM